VCALISGAITSVLIYARNAHFSQSLSHILFKFVFKFVPF